MSYILALTFDPPLCPGSWLWNWHSSLSRIWALTLSPLLVLNTGLDVDPPPSWTLTLVLNYDLTNQMFACSESKVETRGLSCVHYSNFTATSTLYTTRSHWYQIIEATHRGKKAQNNSPGACYIDPRHPWMTLVHVYIPVIPGHHTCTKPLLPGLRQPWTGAIWSDHPGPKKNDPHLPL